VVVSLRAIQRIVLASIVCFAGSPLWAAQQSGVISGVVVDASGTPQMGASVLISSEKLLGVSQVKLLTNARGAFSSAVLPAGLYSLTVTLAGFVPSVESHLEVNQTHATLVQVVLGSVFSSLDQLRGQTPQRGASDDWVWVLRSSAGTRAVLRWEDTPIPGLTPTANTDPDSLGHALMEVSSGSTRPASISNSAVAPATSFAYDIPLGLQERFLVAGQLAYLKEASATALAAAWLPSGDSRTGPVTTIVMRQSQLGPGGAVFRGVRLSHDEELVLGDRVNLRYGAEYVFAGFGSSASALRPRGEVAVELTPTWQASAALAMHPWQDALGDTPDALQSTLSSFDAFPTLMLRHAKPVFESDLHEELALKHSLRAGADLSAAVFHDRSSHTAVLGVGPTAGADFVQGFFGDAFAYDGGTTQSSGARVVYHQRVSDDLATTVIYDYSGALALGRSMAGSHLRDRFDTALRQSVATKVSARVPGVDTRFVVGYKWLDGATISQQDPYGEAMYGVDPYLSLGIRQPLPNIFPARIEMQADVGNLLQQGCVPVVLDGRQLALVPAYRYFRGGLTLQF
jgi:hypothetical protein